jgi:hypothetical protein
MKKMLYALAIILSLGNISNAHSGISELFGDSSSYAFYFTDHAQSGIAPHHIVEVSNLATNSNSKFDVSPDGGIVVPAKGNYLINYRVLANSQVSLALYKNGNLIPESAIANTSASPVFGNVIIPLRKKDVVTIRSIEVSKTFNTVSPVSTVTPTMPVTVTVQFLDD